MNISNLTVYTGNYLYANLSSIEKLYGGYLDLAVGNVYSNWFDFSSILNNRPDNSKKVNDNLYFFTYNNSITGMSAPPIDYVCNMFHNTDINNPTAWGCGWTSAGWIRFYTDSTITTSEDFMNLFQQNTPQLLIKSSNYSLCGQITP